jgi:serine/threonine protein kinase/tetratricopeptide (TPR) repeat protein
MAAIAADRDLLFGLLALQNGLIDQVQLVAAFQAWTRDKGRPLAEHLVARGDLDADQRAGVEAMVTLHLKKHGSDAAKSLAAVPAGRSTRESLARLGDADIEASLGHARPASTLACDDADRTASYSVGTTTSEGQRFRVLRPHAHGGLGAVFVALDTELHREVALKQILDHHADDPISRQRFLLEAEVTGGLEHPGVVPVYGLGAYADGRPYYAMRFIQGDSLKQAIDRFHSDEGLQNYPGRSASGGLELRKLLRRFTDVCNAIAYAHSRGVLHRDIKPGNVIVGRYGETLVVDWGLAKAVGRADLGSAPGVQTLVPSSSSGLAETLPGSALGTPSYMSPEQAAGELDRLGPRSDVYSLGATLYCLLTGKPPFLGDDPGLILRQVQQGELPAPRTLDPTIDRALEAVCLKAMALQPEDRYASPRELAEDVERWMADEPVAARREPFSRRARRWARRNRTAVAAALVALGAGVVGLGAVAGVQSRANRALRKANDATKQALAQSEESRKQAEAVSTFLVGAFRSPDPWLTGRDVKVADVLDRASAELDEKFAGAPVTKGALLDALGRTYLGLGLYDTSVSLLTRARSVREAALGLDHPDTLTSCNNLGVSYDRAGLSSEAIAILETTLKFSEVGLGPDHLDTLKCRHNLADAYDSAGRIAEAIALHESNLKLQESALGPDHPDTLTTRNNLANVFKDAGRLSEAIALHELNLKLREAKLGPDHPFTLGSRDNLANAYRYAGRAAEAILIMDSTLKRYEAKLGPDHPDTLISRNNLALAYSEAGRTAESIALHEPNLKLREAKLGFEHPLTLRSRNNLANVYLQAGRTADAIALEETTLKLRESKLGRDHPDTLTSRISLCLDYTAAGRILEAIGLAESTLKLCEVKLGPDHPYTLILRRNLAEIYEFLGRCAEAEGQYRHVLARRRRTVQPESPFLADDLTSLGRNLLGQSRWSEAEPLLREALAIRANVAPDDWARYDAVSVLGGSLLGQGRIAEAEPLVVAGYEGLKARELRIVVAERFRLREAAERVVRLYEDWSKTGRAAAWKAKLSMPDLPAEVFARP